MANIEDVNDNRLVEISKMTVEAIDDPILTARASPCPPGCRPVRGHLRSITAKSMFIQQPFGWYWEDPRLRISSSMRRSLRPIPVPPGRRRCGLVQAGQEAIGFRNGIS
jgi:hypothetical protein